jgi:hypothetical protein
MGNRGYHRRNCLSYAEMKQHRKKLVSKKKSFVYKKEAKVIQSEKGLLSQMATGNIEYGYIDQAIADLKAGKKIKVMR